MMIEWMRAVPALCVGSFCLLFCYLFLDRFLFRRRLDDLLFGRLRRRLAGLLRRAACRLDGAGMSRQQPEEPAPKPDLVTLRHYSRGQSQSNEDSEGHSEPPIDKKDSFVATQKRPDDSPPGKLPVTLLRYFPATPPASASEDADEVGEPPAQGDIALGQTITCEHINLIMALCKGRSIPDDQRRALYKALLNTRHSMMLQKVVESINGSDQRIRDYLNHAEREFSASAE